MAWKKSNVLLSMSSVITICTWKGKGTSIGMQTSDSCCKQLEDLDIANPCQILPAPVKCLIDTAWYVYSADKLICANARWMFVSMYVVVVTEN